MYHLVIDTTYQQLSYIYLELGDTNQLANITATYNLLRRERYHLTSNRLACSYVTTLIEQGRDEKALQYVTQRLNDVIDSEDVCILQAQHKLYMNTQQFHLALHASQRIIALIDQTLNHSTLNTGHKLNGKSLLALNRPHEAVDALSLAHSIDPLDVDCMLWLAYAHETVKRDVEAEEMYSRAVRIEGGVTTKVWLALGKVQQRLRLFESAVNTLSQGAAQCAASAVSVTNECTEMHLHLGLVQHHLGDLDGAQVSLLLAATHPPFQQLVLAELEAIAKTLIDKQASSAETVMETLPVPPSSAVAETTAETEETISASVPEANESVLGDSLVSAGETTSDAEIPSEATEDVAFEDTEHPEDGRDEKQISSEVGSADVIPMSSDDALLARDSGLVTEIKSPTEIDVITSQPAVPASPALSVDKLVVSAEQYLRMARAFLSKGLYPQALKETAKAARKAPRHAPIYLVRSDVFLGLGQEGSAVDDLLFVWSGLNEQSEEVFTILMQRARDLSVRGMHSVAARLLFAMDHSEWLREADRDVHLFVVQTFSSAGNISAAIASLDRMTAMFRDDNSTDVTRSLDTITLYADLYERSDRADQAVEIWLVAVQQGVATLSDLGDVFARLGRHSEAIESYEKHLDSLHIEKAEAATSEVLLRNRAVAAAVHKKIGNVYAVIAASSHVTANNEQVSSTNRQTNSIAASIISSDSSFAVQKAHLHFLEAMQGGVHDTDIRRFFATHPLPQVAVVSSGSAIPSTNNEASSELGAVTNKRHIKPTRPLVSKRRPRAVFSRVMSAVTDDVLAAAAAAAEGKSSFDGTATGEGEESVDRPLASIPFSSGRHRWVVRRIVDQVKDEEAELSSTTATKDEDNARVRKTSLSFKSTSLGADQSDSSIAEEDKRSEREPASLSPFETLLRDQQARVHEEAEKQKHKKRSDL
eukprot:gene22806-28971_t